MKAEMLKRLAEIEMPAESFRQVVALIAEMQAREDERRGRDRERKSKPSNSMETSLEIPRKILGNGAGKDAEKTGGFLVRAESKQADAWEKHLGKPIPFPRSGVWMMPTEWPPEQGAQQ